MVCTDWSVHMLEQAQVQSVRSRAGRVTREVILAAARRLMHVHGYRGTSLDDVLRESRVAKGNFYYHFRSKEDLGHALLDHLVEEFLEKTLAPCFADPSASPIGQVRCFLQLVVDMQRRANCVGGCPLGNLAAELSDMHEGFRARLAEVFTTWQDRLTDAFRRSQARGELLPTCEPASLASFVVASLEGAILLAKLTKDIGMMERCMAELGRYLAFHEAETSP
jgi:TetR/AcrR family transcriptional regulator, transcriptional repressor for nem operon